MDHRLYITALYDIYGELLTNKQQEYFEDYYFNNFTLAEISENLGITRTAVHNQIKEAEEKLEHYEKILRLKEKKEKIIKYIKEHNEEKILELL